MAGDAFLGPKILVLPCDSEACINSKDSIRQVADRPALSPGSAVRRVDRPGTPSDRPVEAAASPVEKTGRLFGSQSDRGPPRRVIHHGRNVTDAAFLVDSLIKAVGCLKKNPGQSTRPGSTTLLPQLRLLSRPYWSRSPPEQSALGRGDAAGPACRV